LVRLTAASSKLVLSTVWQCCHHTPTPRGRAVAARVAHNHKVAGSSPAPATKISARLMTGIFLGRSLIRNCDAKKVVGENCQWQFAREPSPDSYAVLAEVLGPQNVGESCPRYQD
jgi:hypothetical protein